MGLKRPALRAISAATTASAEAAFSKKVSRAKGGTAAGKAALALAPESSAVRLGQLYLLVSLGATELARRRRLVAQILDRLRRELPAALAKVPVTVRHFGCKTTEEFVKLVGDALLGQQTGSRTPAEFRDKIEGWRWDFVGRVLFERLVKHHAKLEKWFRETAVLLLDVVNQGIVSSRAPSAVRRGGVQLVDASGALRKVASGFGLDKNGKVNAKALSKVLEWRLTGADGVERAFTDHGFIAPNEEGLWAALPVEVKMPRAMSKVGKQFSEWVPRLAEAKKLVVVVEEAGAEKEIEIPPLSLVFMDHDRGQLAVTGLTEKALQKRLSGSMSLGSPRAVRPDEVASLISVDQWASTKHGAVYYRVVLLVTRSWLEPLIRSLTDPP